MRITKIIEIIDVNRSAEKYSFHVISLSIFIPMSLKKPRSTLATVFSNGLVSKEIILAI